MIPTHNKIGQGMSFHFEKLLDEYGKKRPHSSLSREQHFQFLPETDK